MKVQDIPMNVHFVGIGGIGMSALAQHLFANGYHVSGSDRTENERTRALTAEGIAVAVGHSETNVGKAEMVVRTSAVDKANVEVAFAQKHGVKVVLREELLGAVFDSFDKKIAVCGVHGKTTTTALIDYVLERTKTCHASFIGGVSGGNNYKRGSGTVVAEACEYNESFRFLHPDLLVCLNVEYDHPDYYKNEWQVKRAFKRFFNNVDKNGTVVLSTSVKRLYKGKAVTFGKGGDVSAENVSLFEEGLSFDLKVNKSFVCKVKSNLHGEHNVNNVLATFATAYAMGLPLLQVAQAVKQFDGVERRWSKVNCNFANVVQDYAHHPTEIKAVVSTARCFQKGKLFVVFQPHTYSRTKALWTKFAKCFDGADKVILLPIFSARESPIKNVTSERLEKSINRHKTVCEYVDSVDDAYTLLTKQASKCDTVLIVGAGDVNKLAELCEMNNVSNEKKSVSI